jgi:hypothetical protein
MNLGDWKEERPDVAQPFDTPDAHFILSQERFFHVDQEDQWPLAQDYLRKAIRQLRRAHLPDEGVLAIVHRCDYVGLVWSEEPVRPNVRGPGPYLSDDWYGAPTWWNP